MNTNNMDIQYQQGYVKGYLDGIKDERENAIIKDVYDKNFGNKKNDYERGLDDAWECARKMYQFNPINNKQLCEELYDMGFNEFICSTTASEAIAKIKEYEEKQKQEDKCCSNCGQPRDYRGKCILYKEGKCVNEYEKWMPKTNNEINVGDEVIYKPTGTHMVVTHVEECLIETFDGDGVCYTYDDDDNYLVKTGRNFSQIEEVLRLMQEDKRK